MFKLKEWLKGKKVYLTAMASILGVVIAWVSGEVESAEGIKMIVVAILAMEGRAAIAKGK